jgi:hypothetical protein
MAGQVAPMQKQKSFGSFLQKRKSLPSLLPAARLCCGAVSIRYRFSGLLNGSATA